jgi:transcriptional regulator with XRE-family HTH domain
MALARIWVPYGTAVRDARIARKWSAEELAKRAGLSRATVYALEAGRVASADVASRVAAALSRRVELTLVDARKRDTRPNLSVDPVHSAMGEFEAAHFQALNLAVSLDEPYQHYQFAGRADLAAWDVDARALLHIENRTRFPDFQEMAGAYNAKREYLAAALTERAGVQRWASQTHVIAALWSSEVLHALRLRTSSFQSICPDPPTTFEGWWRGELPTERKSSTLIVLDPHAKKRERAFAGLEDALRARPRYRGYADVVDRLAAENG